MLTSSEDAFDHQSGADSLKIAWRYENKAPINTDLENKNIFGHNFDLSKVIDKNILSKTNVCIWNEYLPDPLFKGIS